MRVGGIVVAAVVFCLASVNAAMADPWVLLVQPPPYSSNPPPYGSWQPFQQFSTRQDCLLAPLSLHYQYWNSDQDLSMRALNGACRDEETGKIETGNVDNSRGDDDDY